MKRVSVIIPAFNAEKYIEQAIDSVLNQSLRPDEVIVINDGSTDDTSAILDSLTGIEVIHQPNMGIGHTLNKGLEVASGDLIAFLDADDLWLPEKLAIQVAELKRMNDRGIVFSLIEQFISNDTDGIIRSQLEIPKQYLSGVHRSAMLIDRHSLNSIGHFTTDYVSEEFLDWYLRAKEADVPVKIVNHVLARRRIHGNNITLGIDRKEANKFPFIIKQALDRRRSGK